MHLAQKSRTCGEDGKSREVSFHVSFVVRVAAGGDADHTAEAADRREELTKIALAGRLMWCEKCSAGFAVDPAQHRVVRVVAAPRHPGNDDVRT